MAKKNTNGPTPAPPDDPEPAYFLSLEVGGVRCFKEKQVLTLSDKKGRPAQWTIILGNNGTGKTTLLQCLAGFEEDPGLTRRESERRFIPRAMHWFSFGRVGFPFPQSETALFSIQARVGVGAKLGTQDRPIGSHALQLRIGKPAIIFSGGQFSGALWCYAYGAGRRLGSASLSQAEQDDATASLFSDKADLRNAEEWLLRLDYSASKPSDIQETQRERFHQVKDLLLTLLPEVEDIRLTSPESTNPTPRVEFHTPYGWVPLRQLGYGYQTLIAWVTDLASRLVERYPKSPNPLHEPAVVLVDEIDLHLHPRWQRTVMGFLSERFPNAQFIATAHSPLIAQAAANANLAVLRRHGDHVVIDNDVDVIRGWRIDQILTSDLFDVESARPPYLDGLLARRKELLTKPDLSQADRAELADLEVQIGELPVGESAEQAATIKLLQETLDLLKQEKNRPGSP